MSICAPHRLQAPCLAVPTLPEALVPSDSSLQGLVPQSQPPRASPRTSRDQTRACRSGPWNIRKVCKHNGRQWLPQQLCCRSRRRRSRHLSGGHESTPTGSVSTGENGFTGAHGGTATPFASSGWSSEGCDAGAILCVWATNDADGAFPPGFPRCTLAHQLATMSQLSAGDGTIPPS